MFKAIHDDIKNTIESSAIKATAMSIFLHPLIFTIHTTFVYFHISLL